METEEQAPKRSRREEAKEERRTRIVEAAFDLLHEHKVANVSIAMIAKRAGVSAATVYNLFGTKGAVLLNVYDRDLESYRETVADRHASDALDAIFQSVQIAAEFYSRDPAFYRNALVAGAAGPTERDMTAIVRSSRVGFLAGLVETAIGQGFLKAQADPWRLAQMFAYVSMGTLADWVADLISLEELEVHTRYGFGVALLSYATDKSRERLEREVSAQVEI